MTLQHLNFFGATGASDEFVLGGCIAHVYAIEIKRLARIAERDGEYATLSGVVSKPRPKSLGTPLAFK